MNLTSFTDYSLRVLIYLKIHGDELSTAAEICQYFQLSRNHLAKVINNLGKLGMIETVRGNKGGIRLSPSVYEQKLGDLVSRLEPDRELVECINKEGQHCKVIHACRLNRILDDAMDNFWNYLNQFTLADITESDISLDASDSPVIEILKQPET